MKNFLNRLGSACAAGTIGYISLGLCIDYFTYIIQRDMEKCQTFLVPIDVLTAIIATIGTTWLAYAISMFIIYHFRKTFDA